MWSEMKAGKCPPRKKVLNLHWKGLLCQVQVRPNCQNGTKSILKKHLCMTMSLTRLKSILNHMIPKLNTSKVKSHQNWHWVKISEKFVKLCWHTCRIVQNSFQFDDFFDNFNFEFEKVKNWIMFWGHAHSSSENGSKTPKIIEFRCFVYIPLLK